MKNKTIKIKHLILLIIALFVILAVRVFFGTVNEAKNLEVKNIELANIKDGTYRGESRLDPVLVVLDVIVKDHKISDINIIEHRNGLGGKAEKPVIDAIKESGKINVDTVAGATISSKTIMKAVENALRGN